MVSYSYSIQLKHQAGTQHFNQVDNPADKMNYCINGPIEHVQKCHFHLASLPRLICLANQNDSGGHPLQIRQNAANQNELLFKMTKRP